MPEFDQKLCADIIAKVAFEVFQSLPDGEPLILTKNGIGSPRPSLASSYRLVGSVYKKFKPVFRVYYSPNGRWVPASHLNPYNCFNTYR